MARASSSIICMMLTVNQSWNFHSYRKASPKKTEESEEEEEEDDDDEEDEEEEEEDDDDDGEEDEEEGEGVTTLEVTTSVSSPFCCLIWWFPKAYNVVSVLWWLWEPEILSVLNIWVVLLWWCFSIGQNFTLMGHQLSVVKGNRILITAEIS